MDPAAARTFAREVVARLRAAGHMTYWAGGCVRDEILGRIPADYDVATAARPEAVRAVFGRRRTLAVGASFGVITVLGPPGAGQVEVATFRSDGAYTDGRHPAGVTFCSAEEDAQRRDFTINGLFLDPLSGEIHDFVGGRADLEAGIVRAIGNPAIRFAEDHLRMLRGVRFAAFFGYVLDLPTRSAIERMAHLVAGVSPERIAAELRSMVSRSGRRTALELLADTGLAREVLPEVAPGPGRSADSRPAWTAAARVVGALDEPDLPLALALLTGGDARAVEAVAARLRLSTRETRKAAWLCGALSDVATASLADLRGWPWSRLQRLAVHEHAAALADALRGRAVGGGGDAEAARWFTSLLARPRVELDPPPLVTGGDLIAAGLPEGPHLGALLARIRTLQLDGAIRSQSEALAIARGDGPG